MVETTETRAAAARDRRRRRTCPWGSHGGAGTPEGGPGPASHTFAGQDEQPQPRQGGADAARSTATRPKVSINRPPKNLNRVMEDEQRKDEGAAGFGGAQAVYRGLGNPVVAEPSVNAAPRTTRPTSRVRPSQAERPLRALAARRRHHPRRVGQEEARCTMVRPTSSHNRPRCAGMLTLTADRPAPTNAPRNAPPLKAAWNCGMVVRPRWRSTSAPSMFCDTSHRPMPTPKKKSATAVNGTERAAAPRSHRPACGNGEAANGWLAVPTLATTCRQGKGDNGSRRNAQQQAHFPGRQVQGLRDGRDPGGPAGKHESVDGENHEGRHCRRNELPGWPCLSWRSYVHYFP